MNSPHETTERSSKINLPLAIKLIRNYHGYSQRDLSNASGLPQSVISEVESSSKTITLRTLEAYSRTLNIPISIIVRFAEDLTDAMEATEQSELSISFLQRAFISFASLLRATQRGDL